MLILELVLVGVVIVALVSGFTFLGLLVHRTGEESKALGAASFLQGLRMKAMLQELKDEILRDG